MIQRGQTNRVSSPLVTVVLAACVAVFGGLWSELFFEWMDGRAQGLYTGQIGVGVCARVSLAAIAIFVACYGLMRWGQTVLSWLFRYRMALGAAIVALCTVFEISGSSVGQWTTYTTYEGPKTTFGTPRQIRWDEFLVFTPSIASQQANGYDATSALLRGGPTDTTLTYALPSWSLATLFRPFLWGFLCFGTTHGLAFFWSARTIALFLASLELARLFTRDNRALSASFGFLIAFAPLVQWWFAINSIAEILIAGELLVIALHHLLRVRNRASCVGLFLLMAWLATCYLLALYPPWQVVMFFVFALMGAFEIATFFRSGARLQISPLVFWLGCALALAIVAGSVLIVFSEASDALAATLGSIYPGHRFTTGGEGTFSPLFFSAQSLYLPFVSIFADAEFNLTEQATFFALFPLGCGLGIWAWAKHRDLLSLLLSCYQLFLLWFYLLGFPEWLAALSLFSNVPFNRVALALGFVENVLLIRGMALRAHDLETLDKTLCEESPREHAKPSRPSRDRWAWLVFLVTFLAVFLPVLVSPTTAFSPLCVALTFFLAMALALASLRAKTRLWGRRVLSITLVCVALPGLFVNPIQVGLAPLFDNHVSQAVRSIVESDPKGRWISEECEIAQLIVASGAPTLNSTNLYPELDLWGRVDPEGAFVDVYNRYANFFIEISEEPTRFELAGQADLVRVDLNVDDLEALDVTYVITRQDLSKIKSHKVRLELLESVDGRNIYRVKRANL